MRHATLQHHLRSIQEEGLRPEKSQGAWPCVWLHTPGRTPWAVRHTQRRHRARPEDIVIFEVLVPRSWLTRMRRGLWICKRPIPPERLILLSDAPDM